MTQTFHILAHTASALPRIGLLLLGLCAPVLAVPNMVGEPSGIIEQAAVSSNGAGFVILVSLQRN